MGFPSFQQKDNNLRLRDVGGPCRPFTGREDGTLEVLTGAHDNIPPEQWKGISGAGVLLDGALAGIVFTASKLGLQARTLVRLRDAQSPVWAAIQHLVVPHQQPTYQSERDRELCEEMEKLYERRAELELEGKDTADLQEQILAIKRQLRSGLELVAGDRLKHRYKLIKKLGRGGFATVWKAYDTRQRRHVAVKVLHGQFAESQERIDRFFRGSRYMRQLKHPHIVDIQSEEERDDDSRRPFFVMELLAGGDLWHAIQREALSVDALFDHVQSIASALAHAHAQGIVHRDVKPANILLTAKGMAKLTDFDLVRAGDTTGGTRTGALGTFIYAAPEAFKDASKAAATADVYGLAMTTVVGLLNRVPELVEKMQPEMLVGQLRIAPPIKEVLKASLQIESSDRPENAGVFLERFKAARFGRNAPTVVAPRPQIGWKEGRDIIGAYADVIVPGTQAGFRMRWIEPGTFLMGSPEDEKGRFDREGPQHEVTLTSGFWMADAPCTQALCEALTGQNPSHFKGADRPVERVSWNEVQAFLHSLNERLWSDPFVLPTEAQWEYACRAGTSTSRYGKLDAIAWHQDNACEETHPVRQKQPNAWGLYDMLGNVWEWCSDGRRRYGSAPQTDPQGPEVGVERTFRGGSWDNSARSCRAAYRFADAPSNRDRSLGFRFIRGQDAAGGGLEGQRKRRRRKPRDERSSSRAVPGAVASPPTIIPPKAEEPIPPWANASGTDAFGRYADAIVPARKRSGEDVPFRMRWIEPGTFSMGSPEDEEGRRDNEGPQHSVTLTQGFWMADTPCIQALWSAVMDDQNPSRFTSPDRPVEQVSWEDVQAFLQRLNERQAVLSLVLPTEAQWEYACRAGTVAASYAGDLEIRGERNAPMLDAIAWYGGNSGVDFDLVDGISSGGWSGKQHAHTQAGTRRVKQKQPNPWGLYDMLGNVLEWCSDGRRRYSSEKQQDPQGPKGGYRVARGGSWYELARYCRAAIRDALGPSYRSDFVGFRFVRGQDAAGGGSEGQKKKHATRGDERSSSGAVPEPRASAPAIITRRTMDNGPEWAVASEEDKYGRYADVAVPPRRRSQKEPTFRMRWIEPGTFLMGSPDDEEGRDGDEPPARSDVNSRLLAGRCAVHASGLRGHHQQEPLGTQRC